MQLFSDPGFKLTYRAPMYHEYLGQIKTKNFSDFVFIWHNYLAGTGAKLVNSNPRSEKSCVFGTPYSAGFEGIEGILAFTHTTHDSG